MLGTDFRSIVEQRGIPCAASGREVDISDGKSVTAFLDRHRDIDVVVNCAAYTDVDTAEKEQERAFLVNGDGPGILARLCCERDIMLYHISTDHIFPGTGSMPRETDSPAAPVNTYGRSKLKGEENIMRSQCRYAIFRTQRLYGKHGTNFVDTITERLMQGTDLRVINDQTGAVTRTADLCRLIAVCMEQNRTGIYHAVNTGYATWYETAVEIQHILGTDCRITPCTSEEYSQTAERPKNCRLSTVSLEQADLSMRPWQDALSEYMRFYR